MGRYCSLHVLNSGGDGLAVGGVLDLNLLAADTLAVLAVVHGNDEVAVTVVVAASAGVTVLVAVGGCACQHDRVAQKGGERTY